MISYTFTTFDNPLGTLGNGASAINNSGQIVGVYNDAANRAHGYLWSGGVFTTIDYPSSSATFVRDISNTGALIGSYNTASGAVPGFIYANGIYTTVTLPVPDPGPFYYQGINTSGQIVGYTTVSSPLGSPTLLTDKAYVYTNGSLVQLSNPLADARGDGPHAGTAALANNDIGQVVGYYFANGGQHGFLYNAGGYTVIDPPSAVRTYARGINNLGQVVGSYEGSDGKTHGFLYNSGTYTTIDDPLGARGTQVYGINDLGQVVGYYTDASGRNHGFVASPQSQNTLRYVDADQFDANGRSDLVFATGGSIVLWLNENNGFTSTPVPNASMGAEWKAADTGDFNGDGQTDIFWTGAAGNTAIWLMNGTSLRQVGSPTGSMGAEWRVAGVGDFGGDRKADIAWGNSSGQVAIWSMDGITLGGFGLSNGHMGAEWNISILGDFNGDANQDLLWVSKIGDVATWLMNGSDVVGLVSVGNMGVAWRAVGAGNFNGDGVSDIVWVNENNNVQIWNMNGGEISQFISPAGRNGLEWHLTEVGDFTGDGRADLLWLTDSGAAQIWSINGTEIVVVPMTTPGGSISTAEPVASLISFTQTAPPEPSTLFRDVAAPVATWVGDDPIGPSWDASADLAWPIDGNGDLYGFLLHDQFGAISQAD